MSDIAKTVRPDVLVAGGRDLDGLLGPLAAYLRALEARVGALERRLSAVPFMTAADAARNPRVSVETILRAVRAGELPVAGYVGRSPRISPDALDGWLATSSPAAPVSSQPCAAPAELLAIARWACELDRPRCRESTGATARSPGDRVSG